MDLFDDQPTPVLMLAGVDEVGRGPLAGPVIAAAVILDPSRPITGLRDSKKLTAARRAELAEIIEAQALAVGVGRAEVAEIDLLNILRASLLAMERAVANLAVQPDVVYVDGNITPTLAMPAVAIVGGDDRVASISAASIVAKVIRDREMDRAAAHYPNYGFERHKGYATAAHLEALERFGPSPLHRMSFAPIRVSTFESNALVIFESEI
ncbi:MAG TPA: ribonuclease HII [Pseudomonadales bacterium]|jgi:ribonuclease HII|nr:ribonuclease HII [Pseudomonadales bacterium]